LNKIKDRLSDESVTDGGLKPAVFSEKMSDDSLAAAIKGLSRKTIARLEEATELSDTAMIDQVLEDIRCENVQLAEDLYVLAKNYDYDKILSLVQKALKQIDTT
jgi:hypothetical protein